MRNTQASAPGPGFVLRGPPNWTAVGFLAGLGSLHLSVAWAAFAAGRWSGHFSLILGTLFIGASVFAACCRFELALLPRQRQLRLRHGSGWLYWQRTIDFPLVVSVRVALPPANHRVRHAQIHIICRDQEIVCPPSEVPGQQALWLAMLLDVPLVKVFADAAVSS